MIRKLICRGTGGGEMMERKKSLKRSERLSGSDREVEAGWRRRRGRRFDLSRGTGERVWLSCAFPYQSRAVGPLMLKNTCTHTLFSPLGFINQTACRALGVIGCPFSLLMARGEERRGGNRRQNSTVIAIY